MITWYIVYETVSLNCTWGMVVKIHSNLRFFPHQPLLLHDPLTSETPRDPYSFQSSLSSWFKLTEEMWFERKLRTFPPDRFESWNLWYQRGQVSYLRKRHVGERVKGQTFFPPNTFFNKFSNITQYTSLSLSERCLPLQLGFSDRF